MAKAPPARASGTSTPNRNTEQANKLADLIPIYVDICPIILAFVIGVGVSQEEAA
jgi:hypothetical protein